MKQLILKYVVPTCPSFNFSKCDRQKACKSNVNVIECGAQEEDKLNTLLEAQEKLTKAEPRDCTAASKSISPLLESFLEELRLSKNEDIFRYWENHKLERLELYQLNNVALAAPATQSQRRVNPLRSRVCAFTALSQLERVDNRQHHVHPREKRHKHI